MPDADRRGARPADRRGVRTADDPAPAAAQPRPDAWPAAQPRPDAWPAAQPRPDDRPPDDAAPAAAPPRLGAWPADDAALAAEQVRLGGATPDRWLPPGRPLRAAGCFVAFERGEAGPGHPGDRAWVGAVVADEDGAVLDAVVVHRAAGAGYLPGYLARREGPMVVDALHRLTVRPDVVLVDATGRDHPRRAGLALHVGAVLDLPSVGVTHRPLVAVGEPPTDEAAGATTPVHVDGEVVGAWVRTRAGVRPVVAHAAWRTDVDTAVEVALRTATTARTPEPLRAARVVAREARSGRGDLEPS